MYFRRTTRICWKSLWGKKNSEHVLLKTYCDQMNTEIDDLKRERERGRASKYMKCSIRDKMGRNGSFGSNCPLANREIETDFQFQPRFSLGYHLYLCFNQNSISSATHDRAISPKVIEILNCEKERFWADTDSSHSLKRRNVRGTFIYFCWNYNRAFENYRTTRTLLWFTSIAFSCAIAEQKGFHVDSKRNCKHYWDTLPLRKTTK